MIIKAGTHAPINIPRPVCGRGYLGYRVAFTDSCKYYIGTDDQADINKLFGIGYFPHHQQKSVRIGWNYNLVSNVVNLFAYWYSKGQRNSIFIESVPIGPAYDMFIVMHKTMHIVETPNNTTRIIVKPDRLGYLLHPYFGGNRVAPHDILIDMHRL